MVQGAKTDEYEDILNILKGLSGAFVQQETDDGIIIGGVIKNCHQNLISIRRDITCIPNKPHADWGSGVASGIKATLSMMPEDMKTHFLMMVCEQLRAPQGVEGGGSP